MGEKGMKIKTVLLSIGIAACATLPAVDWKVPNWSTIVTEMEATNQWDGKVWCGHIQGMCVSSNAIYFSYHNQIIKTDWFGRFLGRAVADRHGGDICLWNGRLYTGVWLKPKKGTNEKWCAAIYVYDAETLELLKVRKMPWDGGADGITALDGIIYLALGGSGKYDPEKGCGRLNWYCRFDAETLERIGEPFSVDPGIDSSCGSQNMTTDGKYIYSSHYTRDEAANTPNVIVHDKDFNVVAKYRFGRNNGLDFVPGGKDGAVRFAWAFTPNWTNGKEVPMVPIYGIVQFAELKNGQVSDLTYYGGFSKFIER